MKVSSSITSSSVRTVGSFKKVSNIPARVQSLWVLSLRVNCFNLCSSCFSLCLATVSFFSNLCCFCFNFSNSSLGIGATSFPIFDNGQNKSDQLFTVDRLWLNHYSVLFLHGACSSATMLTELRSLCTVKIQLTALLF